MLVNSTVFKFFGFIIQVFERIVDCTIICAFNKDLIVSDLLRNRAEPNRIKLEKSS